MTVEAIGSALKRHLHLREKEIRETWYAARRAHSKGRKRASTVCRTGSHFVVDAAAAAEKNRETAKSKALTRVAVAAAAARWEICESIAGQARMPRYTPCHSLVVDDCYCC